MASKRKRDNDESLSSTPASKLLKQEEVTRSGRVRKKPAKFADNDEDTEETTTATRPQTVVRTPVRPVPLPPVTAQVLTKEETPVHVEALPPHAGAADVAPVVMPSVTVVTVPVPTEATTEQSAVQSVMFKEELDDDVGRTPGRSGRMRKKSAKVLEMEEFEEAEKKQFSKKSGSDAGKKAAGGKVPLSPTATGTPKVKTSSLPVTAALAAKLLPAKSSPVLSPGAVQAAVGAHTITEADLKAVMGGKDPEAKFIQIKSEQQMTTPTKIAVSPQKAVTMTVTPESSPQAGKTEQGQGSVIKLLLSSPAQNTNPSLTTKSVANVSPPQEKPTPAGKKKSKTKSKAGVSQEITPSVIPGISSPVKQELPKLKMALGINPQGVSPVKLMPISVETNISTTPSTIQDQEGLKMKFVLSPKETLRDQQVPGIQVGPSTKKVKEATVKPKKVKKGMVKEEPVVKITSPGQISPPVTVSIDKPGDSPKKKKTPKSKQEKEKPEIDKGYLEEEFGLDMEVEEIPFEGPGDESLMDMEDDESLIISDEGLMPVKAKPVVKVMKKKVKAKDTATMSKIKNIQNIDGELVMDFERMKGSEKKASKKKQIEQSDPEKVKKKRAPTAYMIWCNVHRPKVVKDNPKIDFSTISKRLGEMWSALSDKEKMVWKRKAKKAAGKGSTLITTGKGGGGATKQGQTPQQLAPSTSVTPPSLKSAAVVSSVLAKAGKTTHDDSALQSPSKGFGIEPVDVASHLKILGESLGLIGMRLQEHREMTEERQLLKCRVKELQIALEAKDRQIGVLNYTVKALRAEKEILKWKTEGLQRKIEAQETCKTAYVIPRQNLQPSKEALIAEKDIQEWKTEGFQRRTEAQETSRSTYVISRKNLQASKEALRAEKEIQEWKTEGFQRNTEAQETSRSTYAIPRKNLQATKELPKRYYWYSGYVLFCCEQRRLLLKENPKMDFDAMSRRLAEMWYALSDEEKMRWKWMAFGDEQQGQVSGKVHGQTNACTQGVSTVSSSSLGPIDTSLVEIEDTTQVLLNGLIAVQGSLSVLLDSMLCACAPLLCLTAQLPETNGCSYETHMKTLDNVGYIMPGL